MASPPPREQGVRAAGIDDRLHRGVGLAPGKVLRQRERLLLAQGHQARTASTPMPPRAQAAAVLLPHYHEAMN